MPKEKGKNGQAMTYKVLDLTNDRAIRTPLKVECKLRCSGGISIYCFTSSTCRGTLFTIRVRIPFYCNLFVFSFRGRLFIVRYKHTIYQTYAASLVHLILT